MFAPRLVAFLAFVAEHAVSFAPGFADSILSRPRLDRAGPRPRRLPTLAAAEEGEGGLRFEGNAKRMYDEILSGTPSFIRKVAQGNMDRIISDVCEEAVTEDDMYEVIRRSTPGPFVKFGTDILDQFKTVPETLNVNEQFARPRKIGVNATSLPGQDRGAASMFVDLATDPPKASSALGRIRSSLALSREDARISLSQLVLFLALARAIRIPSVANGIARTLRHFPTGSDVKAFEPLSAATWLVHIAHLAYNLPLFRSLWRVDANGHGEASRKKRAYAVGAVALGHVHGVVSVLSHSLVGTGLGSAETSLLCFAHALVSTLAISLGGLILLPTSWGIPFFSAVGLSIVKGWLLVGSFPAIMLSTSGLLAVLLTNETIFPRLFKMGYAMFSTTPIIEHLLDHVVFHAGSDVGHMIGTLWILIVIIIQRASLQEKN
ncbi:hypothetical protein ACHAWF_006981 [Thalassiosira exigua]